MSVTLKSLYQNPRSLHVAATSWIRRHEPRMPAFGRVGKLWATNQIDTVYHRRPCQLMWKR
jgi:hypothetical protein